MQDQLKHKKLNKVLESSNNLMLPLKTHARGLSEYFYAKNTIELTQVGNWFWTASSINNIEYDGIKYDSAFMMCRPAYEYEKEKQNLHSNVINSLTTFLYVYSGFEALINSLNLSKCSHKAGKINSVTHELKTNYSVTFSSLPSYLETLQLTRKLIQQSRLKSFEQHFSLDECTDVNGVGLKIVYKLRNQFAHGEYDFPESDNTDYLPVESDLIQLASRIILQTAQMVLISRLKGNNEELYMPESEIIEYDEQEELYVNELSYLWGFHVKTKNSFPQLQLFSI